MIENQFNSVSGCCNICGSKKIMSSAMGRGVAWISVMVGNRCWSLWPHSCLSDLYLKSVTWKNLPVQGSAYSCYADKPHNVSNRDMKEAYRACVFHQLDPYSVCPFHSQHGADITTKGSWQETIA